MALREIVFDTETTGLDPFTGDRVVEIGCVELINHLPTPNNYHVYINPERDMPEEAFKVHGLSEEFLSDKPKFAEIAQDFHDFIKDTPIIAHNASFDVKFLNWELEKAGFAKIDNDLVIDTLAMARQRFPAGPNSLDALCSRFSIDSTKRTLHGALLDSEILADVYLELIGGRQTNLMLSAEDQDLSSSGEQEEWSKRYREPAKQRPAPLPLRLSAEEIERHQTFLKEIKGDSLWARYLPQTEPEATGEDPS
ncbi:DNA polymerase-3 subunit epsilon [Cohaesibacter sp. ES.047]|uniref:DNA polymerase III subunit epsilon n=1 Tax=Cohaesibacter sp. ES.047 TaxID=1798205 RepID=UPI000BB8B1C5|nr:DNA polymerase III subunit epsilon [Cohaesibacter sp. ES.047]SNY90514.1 DNA polymerase-3 subunit epsilon [Cohaesibacter sp. ES.047]